MLTCFTTSDQSVYREVYDIIYVHSIINKVKIKLIKIYQFQLFIYIFLNFFAKVAL